MSEANSQGLGMSEEVVCKRTMMHALNQHDTDKMYIGQTANFFGAGTAVNVLQQQRNVVEYTPRESKADANALRSDQVTDSFMALIKMGKGLADNGMTYRYANQNPESR